MSILETVDAERLVGDPQASVALPEREARRLGAVPLAWRAPARPGAPATLIVALDRIDDPLVREPLRRVVAAEVELEPRAATLRFVRQALGRCYPAVPNLPYLLEVACACENIDRAGAEPGEDDGLAVALIDALLREACARGASDVHLSPAGRRTRLRWRIDGLLAERARWPIQRHASLVQRLKVLAGLDVAECRAPQDGGFERLLGGERVAFRLSCFPVAGGENAVLRVQDPGRRPASLAALGLPASMVDRLIALLERPSGLLLVVGPTGSGKTTTLYALLGALDDGTRNLVTLEDPIEYAMDGLTQATVDPGRGLDFAAGARALLRQDPDVLMLGEIRDAATAEVAQRAALAGHRVLATLHADDAIASVARLLELGADAATLARCLNGIVAQRLLANGAGDGRFAVLETLVLDASLRQALADDGIAAFAALDARRPRQRLHDAARAALAAGRTDAASVLRVFGRLDRADPGVAHGKGPA